MAQEFSLQVLVQAQCKFIFIMKTVIITKFIFINYNEDGDYHYVHLYNGDNYDHDYDGTQEFGALAM